MKKASGIKKVKAIIKQEKRLLLFLFFLMLYLSPLFSSEVFLTLDGPSHLYNAKVFNELLFQNEKLSEFYTINNELVPNYTGHLLLSALLLLFSPLIALKVFHVAYVLALSLSFRKLIVTLNPCGEVASLLIFPLVYSASFIAGFYNFSIAIILSIITLTFWLKHKQDRSGLKYLGLGVLFLVLYFSHSFVFAVLCLSIAVDIITESIKTRHYKAIFTEGIKVFAVALPMILLLIFFTVNREAKYEFLPFEILFNNLVTATSLFVFSETRWLNYLFLGMLFFLAVTLVFQFKTRNQKSDFILIMILVTLCLYFIMPDSVGYASVFSQRMQYLFLMSLSIWVATQNIDKKVLLVFVVLLTFHSVSKVRNIEKWTFFRSNRAKEMMAISKMLAPNSIILSVRKITVWEFNHLSNLLGIERPQIILENYEASHDYFPVRWKENVEEIIKSSCEWEVKLNNKIYKVDYLVVFGFGESDNVCEQEREVMAKQQYKNIYHSAFADVYQIRE